MPVVNNIEKVIQNQIAKHPCTLKIGSKVTFKEKGVAVPYRVSKLKFNCSVDQQANVNIDLFIHFSNSTNNVKIINYYDLPEGSAFIKSE